MLKHFLSTSVLSIALVTTSFATNSNLPTTEQHEPRLAANGASKILAETDTKETAAAAFRGLEVTEALKRLVDTQTCYLKHCFIKSPELRAAYHAFCMDPQLASAYLKGDLPVEIPSLLAQISKPDFIEATTLVRASRDMWLDDIRKGGGGNTEFNKRYDNIRALTKTHKSLCGTLNVVNGPATVRKSCWRVNDEMFRDNDEGITDSDTYKRRDKVITLFDMSDFHNNCKGFYFQAEPTYAESIDHLSCLLRSNLPYYFSTDGTQWKNEARLSKKNDVAVFLWSLVTQKTRFTDADLSFCNPSYDPTSSEGGFLTLINLDKLGYWFYQNVTLAPRDVNKRTPFAINPDFFLNHGQIKFSPYSLREVIVGLEEKIARGDKVDPTHTLWLSCAALQLKDSYLAYDDFIDDKKPAAQVVAYFKLLSEMFFAVDRDCGQNPLHAEVGKEAKLLNANISAVIPYLEDYQSVQTMNKDFLARMSPHVQAFVKHYLMQNVLEEQDEMTEEEKAIADSLI